MAVVRHLSELSSVEYFGFGFNLIYAVALVCIGLFKSAEAFLKLNIFSTLVYGVLWLSAPVHIIKLFEIQENIDGAHMWLAQANGITLLCSAACMYACLGTSDNTVTTSFLWSKITMALLCIMIVLDRYGNTQKVTESWPVHGIYSLIGCVVFLSLVIGCIAQLRHLDNFGGYMELRDRMSFHLRLEFVFAFMTGISFYAFPVFHVHLDTTLKSVDALHVYLSRCVGVMWLESTFIAVFATKFQQERTKARFLICRFVFYVTTAVSTIGGLYSYGILNIPVMSAVFPLFVIAMVNCLVAFLFCRHEHLK